jgi:hypothetical protein
MLSNKEKLNVYKKYKKNSETAFKQFIKFLSKQDKIKTAEDLVPGLHYEYISGIPNIVYRCILRKRPKEFNVIEPGPVTYDAMINIEISLSECTYVYIKNHNIGKRLDDINSWVNDKK